MARALGNYLQLLRRQSGFSQAELAFLLGYGGDAIVSRIERDERGVTLAVAFACQLIFGAVLTGVFPGLYEDIEDGVVRRMYELHGQLKSRKPSRRTSAKLRVLEDALARATEGAHRERP
jgi:transcriptional regulator with XRE-family HTH domain